MSFATDPAKRKPRLLTVSESCRYYPRITISGSWMCDWGFSIKDRVFLLKIANGETLIRIGSRLEQSDITKYCRQQRALIDFPIRDAPSYYLGDSRDHFPEIIITGAWLRDWGFATGDRISLTWTEEGHMSTGVLGPFAFVVPVRHLPCAAVQRNQFHSRLVWHCQHDCRRESSWPDSSVLAYSERCFMDNSIIHELLVR